MDKNKIVYLCDGKACGENHNCGNCKYTTDITHAKNFHRYGYDPEIYMENEEESDDNVAATED